MKKILSFALISALVLTGSMAFAAEEGNLEIGLDYRFRVDSLEGKVHDHMQFTGNPLAPNPVTGYTVKNETLYMNRFGMHMKANPVEDVSMKARIDMYKISGHQTSDPLMNVFFADRYGASNDGTASHVPEDSILRVDYAYATVSNIFEAPLWFSVGRRPSTGGIPSNIRQNNEKMGTAGIPSLMVNYAFDGMTLGYAPEIDALPGFYTKLCYGRGFDSGYQVEGGATLRDTDFYGLNAALYDSEALHVEVQYQIGKNIFDAPSDAGVTANLGDIKWLGGVVMGKVSSLNLFATSAVSKTDANGHASAMGPGLLNDMPSTDNHSGFAFYVGGRYDIAATGTKVGLEFNHGSKNWISMVPAEDDLWTGKLGTRGDVYEVYLIQSLNRKAIAPKGEAFIRLGYQLYKFEYSNSNNWIGSPHKISDMSTTNPMLQEGLEPVESAQDIYLTFDVRF